MLCHVMSYHVMSCRGTSPLHNTYLELHAIEVAHQVSLLNCFHFNFNWMIEEEEAADYTDMPSGDVLAEAINAVE